MNKSRAIITLVGTSLLSGHIEALLDNNTFNEFSKFIDGYDKAVHTKPNAIIKCIKQNQEGRLVTHLKETIANAQASAETHSLSHMTLGSDDTLYFLCSNTRPGKICAQTLYEYYKGKYEVFKHISIKSLKPDTFNQGLRELTNKIVGIIRTEKEKGHAVIINATGGYKPESIYATLSGILEDIEVMYIHEEFDRIVELPRIPINFDLSIFHRNATWLRLARQGSREAYDKLPRELKELISFNESQDSPFTPLGAVLWNAYLSSVSPRGRIFPDIGLANKLMAEHQDKVSAFIAKWDSLWVGDQVPQMVEHGHSHCQNVLNLAEDALLPILSKNENFLTEKELYYLIASIFLHDVGHAVTVDGNGEILLPEEIRKNHSALAWQMIKSQPEDFGFDTFNDEARVIATICKYHQRKWNLSELPEFENNARLRLITALLRVFDACDRQISRAGEENYREMQLHANEREKKLCEQILQKKNPQGWSKKYFENKIQFIKKQEEHFEIHSKIAFVHIEPEKINKKWQCNVIYHPAIKDEKIQEFETYIDGELEAPCVRKTLIDNSLEFKTKKGEFLSGQ